MMIIDDILLFPIRSSLWIFRKIHNAAQQELATEAESITAQLSEIYLMLESGKITEIEFDRREKELLHRLDEIQTRNAHTEEEPEEE